MTDGSAKRPVIVVVDDMPENLDLIRDVLTSAADWAVHTYDSSLDALAGMEMHGADVLLTDLRMPDLDGIGLLQRVRTRWPQCKVVIITGYGCVEDAVQAIKCGATDFLTKPLNCAAIPAMVERLLALRTRELGAEDGAQMVRAGDRLRAVIELADRVAGTGCTVLVYGETGVGKEVLADHIVAHSGRQDRPYIKVSCAAFTESLAESELFGHEQGAFTGAVKRHIGRFERAHRGTLFLDEIGELSAAMQTKLLRVLQNHEVERVGGSEPVKVDFRLICATHRNLEHMVAEGTFRQDLYYRINTVPIHIPPLRARRDEIPTLARTFLRRARASLNCGPDDLDAGALVLLQSYAWPGNVRELQNCMERACLVARESVLRAADIWWLDMPANAASPGSPAQSDLSPLDAAEQLALKTVLVQHEWNFTRAAQALSVSRSTLYLKAGKYGLTRPVA